MDERGLVKLSDERGGLGILILSVLGLCLCLSLPGKGFAATAIGGGCTYSASSSKGPMELTETHNGNFKQGDIGDTYTIRVSSSGGYDYITFDPTGNGCTVNSTPVTVVDALPTGLTATAMSGTGWDCNFNTLTCTRSDSLAAGTSYPDITLTVNVANNAPANLTNAATVSGTTITATTITAPTVTTSFVLPATTNINTDTWSTDPADDQTLVSQLQAASVPTMNEWGMIFFMIFAGIGSAYYLKRRKTL